MSDTSSLFSQVIQEHLDLKRKNAELEREMPLARYMEEDPFENHPLFKTEEQARIEDTMSGHESIESAPSPLSWPTEDTFIDAPAPAADGASEPDADAESDEGLWTRSRDFDWGD
jgi:hypothetical protein